MKQRQRRRAAWWNLFERASVRAASLFPLSSLALGVPAVIILGAWCHVIMSPSFARHPRPLSLFPKSIPLGDDPNQRPHSHRAGACRPSDVSAHYYPIQLDPTQHPPPPSCSPPQSASTPPTPVAPCPPTRRLLPPPKPPSLPAPSLPYRARPLLPRPTSSASSGVAPRLAPQGPPGGHAKTSRAASRTRAPSDSASRMRIRLLNR